MTAMVLTQLYGPSPSAPCVVMLLCGAAQVAQAVRMVCARRPPP